jgi:hypothetical protein
VAHLGQRQAPATLLEQLLAQRLLERAELQADRGRRQAQLLRRLGHAALAEDRPEVEQVVVVEPLHAARVREARGPRQGNNAARVTLYFDPTLPLERQPGFVAGLGPTAIPCGVSN